MRPIDLARPHGLSTQAVRNYEDAGIIPPAHRSASGYRDYTATHAAGLAAFLALTTAAGYARSRQIMRAATAGQIDAALEQVDEAHALLDRDRRTLQSVEASLARLAAAPAAPAGLRAPLSIGELARHLGLSPATLRAWERAAVLTPRRAPRTGHRTYLAEDVRDAELAHLLRRGGQGLGTIAAVLAELRDTGGRRASTATMERWRGDLRSRGMAQLRAAGALWAYLEVLDGTRASTTGGVGQVGLEPTTDGL